MSLIKLRLFPFMPKLLRAFTLNECWILQNAFSASVKVIPWFFYFSLTWWLYWLVCEYWASLSFWDKLPELWGVTLFICVCVCVCVCVCAQLCLALCGPMDCSSTPLSMGLSRQEYWSGLPFPTPGESSQPRDWTHISCASCIVPWILYYCTTLRSHILFLCCWIIC